MGLNMGSKEQPQQAAPKPRPDTLSLELALYENYRYGNITYVKGKQYIFKREDANLLLQEEDAGRPIWKIWRPKIVRRKVEKQVHDMTGQRAPIQPLNVDEDGEAPDVSSTVTRQSLEIGDESELEELGLTGEEDNGDGNDEGNVTV